MLFRPARMPLVLALCVASVLPSSVRADLIVSSASPLELRPRPGAANAGTRRPVVLDVLEVLWDCMARFPGRGVLPRQAEASGVVTEGGRYFAEAGWFSDAVPETADTAHHVPVARVVWQVMPLRQARGGGEDRSLGYSWFEPASNPLVGMPVVSEPQRAPGPTTPPPVFLDEDPWLDRAHTPIQAIILLSMLTLMVVLWIRREHRSA